MVSFSSLSLWPLRALPGTEGGVKARKGIVRALYNRTFREIVTVEVGWCGFIVGRWYWPHR